MGSAIAIAGVWSVYLFGHFLVASPETALIHPEQVRISNIHYVPPTGVIEIFAADRGRSILRIPLAERRQQIEAIPWVEHATVRRVFPNRIEVDVVERTPIAYLRQGSDLSLVDAHGVILERPIESDFHFPVVTGIAADMPRDDREARMQLFSLFSQQVDSAHPGAMDRVSEVDLSDVSDLRASVTGLQEADISAASSADSDADSQNQVRSDAPVMVHFGDADFGAKYQSLIENIGQWRATVGRVESVDLRFLKEAVVNPDTQFAPLKHAPLQVSVTKHGTKRLRRP
jgi:cell division protein FtsQ